MSEIRANCHSNLQRTRQRVTIMACCDNKNDSMETSFVRHYSAFRFSSGQSAQQTFNDETKEQRKSTIMVDILEEKVRCVRSSSSSSSREPAGWSFTSMMLFFGEKFESRFWKMITDQTSADHSLFWWSSYLDNS